MRAYDPAAGERARGLAAGARGRRRSRTRCARAPMPWRFSPNGTSSAGWTSTGSRRCCRLRSCSTPATCSTRPRCGATGYTYEGVGGASARHAPAAQYRRRRPRAVVTGAAGFLGSHLCERLVEPGGRSSVSTTSSPAGLANLEDCSCRRGFTFEHYDVTNFVHVAGPGRRGTALRQPGQPRRLPRASDQDDEGRFARDAQHARARAAPRGASSSSPRRARSTATRRCTRRPRTTGGM